MMFLEFFFLSLLGHCLSSLLVTAPPATFEGVTLTAKNGYLYNAFRGIPYAKPPIGELRFKDPVPLPPREEIYEAKDFRPYCIQLNVLPSEFDIGQEDCLYLNVFTPQSAIDTNGALKKVFVFIHGGGYMNGFPDFYLPGNLVTEQDIIVVTMSYRLGWLGFLSMESPSCEGNFGLKDQIVSIAWVKENIKAFGGDSDGITLSGESAGGISTSLLSIASGTKNLFARAFSMSAVTGVEHPVLLQQPRATAFQLARAVNCLEQDQTDPVTNSDIRKIIECLQQVPAVNFSVPYGGQPTLGPVQYGGLFPKEIEELFKDEDYLDVIDFFGRDYLVGFNNNEGDIFNAMSNTLMPEEQKNSVSQDDILRGMVSSFITRAFGEVSQEIISKVANYYTKNNEINPVADFAADAIFHIPTYEWTMAISKRCPSKSSKVRIFRFVHWPEFMAGEYKGMVHGTDLLYLFDIDPDYIKSFIDFKINGSKWNALDDQLKRKYISMVGSFIKTGDPGKALTDDLQSGWPAFDPEGLKYLQFGPISEVKDNFRPESVELWSSQIPKWIREQNTKEEL